MIVYLKDPVWITAKLMMLYLKDPVWITDKLMMLYLKDPVWITAKLMMLYLKDPVWITAKLMMLYLNLMLLLVTTQIARFMGPTWGPHGADRTQVGHMLGPWALLSGNFQKHKSKPNFTLVSLKIYLLTHWDIFADRKLLNQVFSYSRYQDVHGKCQLLFLK